MSVFKPTIGLFDLSVFCKDTENKKKFVKYL